MRRRAEEALVPSELSNALLNYLCQLSCAPFTSNAAPQLRMRGTSYPLNETRDLFWVRKNMVIS